MISLVVIALSVLDKSILAERRNVALRRAAYRVRLFSGAQFLRTSRCSIHSRSPGVTASLF